MTDAKRDNNSVTAMLGTSNADGVTPLPPYVDSSTNRLLVNATITGAISVTFTGTTDNSAFVAGTTTGQPMMGFYHSTIDTVTDGRTAVLAMDSKRSLFVVIRDAAGNARGLNVDATGAIGVNIASGGVASGAVASGAFASGSIASGAIASGAVASGAIAAGAFAAGSIPAGAISAGALSFVKLEDVASADGDAGVPAMAIQKATPIDTGGTDGDYVMLQMSAGRLWTASNIDKINNVTPLMGNGVTGTGSLRVTLASDMTAISTAGYMSVKFDQTTPGTTNAVSLAQIGATTVVNGGLAGTLGVGGATATNVAITDNPLNLGAQAVSSENSAATTARKVQLVADLVGKLIVLPYANPENFLYGATAAIVDTTGTAILASAGGSLRNYVTSIAVFNSHATVSSVVEIRDGTTTVMFRGYALAAGGGFTISFPTPLRGTAATAVNAYVITTGSNIYVSATGYKGL